jgi:hypothetical protein
MDNSILLKTFQKLSAKERKGILAWCGCDYFNRRKEVERLCAHLVAASEKPVAGRFSAEKMCAAAFPDAPFDHRALRHTMTYLLEIVRRFVAVAELETQAEEQHFFMVRGLHNRGLDSLFEKEMTAASENLAISARRDARWQLDSYRLAQQRLEVSGRNERTGRLDLRPLQNHLTHFYLTEMLRYGCSALTHQGISAQAYDFETLAPALEMAAKLDLAAHPSVAIYYHACLAFQKSDETAHFENWKQVLAENERCFGHEELRSIYFTGINFCVRSINRGQKQYIFECFEIYRAALDRDLLRENGWLTGFTFKNIIRIGTTLGEHVWVADFFEKNKNFLPPKSREQLIRYNEAYLFFQKNDFAHAMPLLQMTDLDDRFNNLDARRMLLRSYVELGEWDALDALIPSFSANLKRQNDLGYHRDANLNLLYFIKKWVDLPKNNRKATEKLLEELANVEPIADKEWLFGKIKG